jgi:CheY-like chemotaxis protein
LARKILLADDSVTAQNMGRKILSDAGYEVITVNNGSAALKKIAEHHPDLIVLDIYMPGYSGLEVCMRLKENRETARIPVLLTVGKLEPFKAEEARKARADAFIIKPFEASELLVALTKLEDKIVPKSEPYKQGRFAKAIAAAEESNQGDSFGDSESGWKDRLRFPSGAPKAPEPEPEVEVATPKRKGFRDLLRRDSHKKAESSEKFERPIPAGLPHDITPEEIAAITAAAEKVGGSRKSAPTADDKGKVARAETAPTQKSEAKPAIPNQPVSSESNAAVEARTRAEAGAESRGTGEGASSATFANVSEDQKESGTGQTAVSEAQSKEIAPPIDTQTPQEMASAQTTATEDKSEAAPVAAEVRAQDHSTPPEAKDKEKDDEEVMAMLQTLSPSNGNRSSESAGEATPAGLAGLETYAGGARWIAESVALEPAEATLALEREMEKAYAAFAAADGARASFAFQAAAAAVTTAVEPISSPIAIEQPTSSVTESERIDDVSAEPSVRLTTANETTTERDSQAAPPEIAAASSQASSVPESTAEASSPVEATEESAASGNSQAQEEDARAAAADTNASEWKSLAPAVSEVPPATQPEESSSQPPPSHEASAEDQDNTESRHETDLASANAAAWANWRQIRDTIVGSTSQTPDVKATFKDVREDEPPAAQPEAMAAAASSDGGSSASTSDPNAISSIVDNMLAELKPKLMEEIARKLKNESKKT